MVPVADQLALGRVPERVVRRSRLELVGRVEPGPGVRGVRPQGPERPGRQGRLEARRVGSPRPVPVEADVAPGEGLVEERVHVGVVAEEALALPPVVEAQLLGRPFAGGGERGLDHLLDRDVAEVQVRREAARVAVGRRAWLRALLRVAAQALLQEAAKARAARPASRPACAATGGTVASRGRASTKAATSSRLPRVERAPRRASRPRPVTRGFAAARCGQASAKALWMRGRRWAAADTGGAEKGQRHDRVRVHREDRDRRLRGRGPRPGPGR